MSEPLQPTDKVACLHEENVPVAIGTLVSIQRDPTGRSIIDQYVVQVGPKLIGVYQAAQLVRFAPAAEREALVQLVP